jgi:hypothetical protein
MKIKNINNIKGIKKAVHTKYSLKVKRKHYFKQIFQTKTPLMKFQNVNLVRLEAKGLTLYDSENHILVALTRNTNEFTYYTTREDKIVNTIKTLIVINNNYNEIDAMKDSLSIRKVLLVDKNKITNAIEYYSLEFTDSYIPRVNVKELAGLRSIFIVSTQHYNSLLLFFI